MTQYEVTQLSIRVRFSDGRRDFIHGYQFDDQHAVAEALGPAEIKRLVTQGALRVIGLRQGLEPGTAIPQHEALPGELEMDASGQRVLRAQRGGMAPRLVPPPLRAAGAPTQRSVHDQPPGTPAGRWTLDPAFVADKPIEVLNALILDRDPAGLQFGPGEESDARAFLTADFAVSGPSPVRPSASGDAAARGRGRGGR